MKTRQFLIPALSALSVTMTSGCADPLVNDWEGVELTSGTQTYDLPYTYSGTYNGNDYSFSLQFYLSINDDFEGEFTYLGEYTYAGQTYEYEYAYVNGVPVLVDGSQAAVHMPVDVQDIDADFYVMTGHKLYGPTGIGVLYATKQLLAQLPPYHTGGEMIKKVTKDKTTFADAPHKFEAGTPPLAQAAGLAAALDYLDEHRPKSDEAKATTHAYDKLKALPQVQLLCCNDPVGSIAFTLKGVHPHDLAQFLDTRDIAIRAGHHCAQPYHESQGVKASARISLGIYNDKKDVDAFMNALQESILTL